MKVHLRCTLRFGRLLRVATLTGLYERMLDSELEKIDGREQPVPGSWRLALTQIADAFVDGRVPAGEGVRVVDAEVARINFENIRDYPDAIGPLRDVCWTTSICAWMGTHWNVLVDLCTADGETSDLVLHAKVFERDDCIEIEPGLIYVP